EFLVLIFTAHQRGNGQKTTVVLPGLIVMAARMRTCAKTLCAPSSMPVVTLPLQNTARTRSRKHVETQLFSASGDPDKRLLPCGVASGHRGLLRFPAVHLHHG